MGTDVAQGPSCSEDGSEMPDTLAINSTLLLTTHRVYNIITYHIACRTTT